MKITECFSNRKNFLKKTGAIINEIIRNPSVIKMLVSDSTGKYARASGQDIINFRLKFLQFN